MIEVMIAIVILTIAILSLVALFASGLRLKTRLTQVTVATEIARETIERAKSLGFAALPAGNVVFDGSAPTAPLASGFPPAPYPTSTVEGRIYTVHVTVAELPGRSRLKSVLVVVSWGDSSNVKLATRMLDS
jgi:Tfp pilus assembly protein PilV